MRKGNVNKPTYGRDGATEGCSGEGAGFFAGGDEGVALRNTGQEGGDVGGGDDFQEGIGCIVAEAADFAGGVVEGQAGIDTKLSDQGFVKPLLPRHAEMQLVPKVN